MEQEDNMNSECEIVDDGEPNGNRMDIFRLIRLTVEAVEAAFFLCNCFLDGYRIDKIYDIVKEILPTAYVQGSGYWLFYTKKDKTCSCICNQFSLICKHNRSLLGFVAMNPSQRTFQDSHVTSEMVGNFFPNEITVQAAPVRAEVLRGYDITIDLLVSQLMIHRNGFHFHQNRRARMTVNSRFLLVPEHLPMRNYLVQFLPDSRFIQVFQSYFDDLSIFDHLVYDIRGKIYRSRASTIIPASEATISIVPENYEHSYSREYQSQNNFRNLRAYEIDQGRSYRYSVSLRGNTADTAFLNTISYMKQFLGDVYGSNYRNQCNCPEGGLRGRVINFPDCELAKIVTNNTSDDKRARSVSDENDSEDHNYINKKRFRLNVDKMNVSYSDYESSSSSATLTSDELIDKDEDTRKMQQTKKNKLSHQYQIMAIVRELFPEQESNDEEKEIRDEGEESSDSEDNDEPLDCTKSKNNGDSLN